MAGKQLLAVRVPAAPTKMVPWESSRMMEFSSQVFVLQGLSVLLFALTRSRCEIDQSSVGKKLYHYENQLQ
jgi:hypothetical protein